MLCRAKINLTLHVGAPLTEGRWSGYHPLESLVVFADVGDTLVIELNHEAHKLQIEGPFSEGLTADRDNLILKALEACDAPQTSVTLTKNLPVSAGLGGGSANAAGILRRFGNGDMDASILGADVPACYHSKTAMMEGIGEQVNPLAGLGRIPAILVNPGRPVSTGAIFKAYDLTIPMAEPEKTARSGSLLDRALSGQNNLQGIAIQIEPAIQDVLDALQAQAGCQLARMSGSGATCFGLFETIEQAEAAAKHVSQNGWWSVPTWLGDQV
ncbi:MAG: 4-(cytidine 5'-diphospho)-2-C-methyl-D-erythritol kinase [Pseudomonadota bacterium]